VTLVPIEGSSSVDSAGFDAERGVIRVLFRSGRFHDYAGRTAADFEEFLAAPSKGRFVHELAGRAATITGPSVLAPLDTFTPDECCSPRISKAIAAGRLAGVEAWECPKCGVDWIPELVPGLGRHWMPRVWFARIR
jgi:hypothetical protein